MDQNQPNDIRPPVNLRIKFRSEGLEQFIERYAIDVSRGGIFIRTREPLPVGTQLRLDFQYQDASTLMSGEGTVVWIREYDAARTGVAPGMGVRFDKLTPDSQTTLEQILSEKAKRDRSGVPGSTGKSSGGIAVRRPSSMFAVLEPQLPANAPPPPVAPRSTMMIPSALMHDSQSGETALDPTAPASAGTAPAGASGQPAAGSGQRGPETPLYRPLGTARNPFSGAMLGAGGVVKTGERMVDDSGGAGTGFGGGSGSGPFFGGIGDSKQADSSGSVDDISDEPTQIARMPPALMQMAERPPAEVGETDRALAAMGLTRPGAEEEPENEPRARSKSPVEQRRTIMGLPMSTPLPDRKTGTLATAPPSADGAKRKPSLDQMPPAAQGDGDGDADEEPEVLSESDSDLEEISGPMAARGSGGEPGARVTDKMTGAIEPPHAAWPSATSSTPAPPLPVSDEELPSSTATLMGVSAPASLASATPPPPSALVPTKPAAPPAPAAGPPPPARPRPTAASTPIGAARRLPPPRRQESSTGLRKVLTIAGVVLLFGGAGAFFAWRWQASSEEDAAPTFDSTTTPPPAPTAATPPPAEPAPAAPAPSGAAAPAAAAPAAAGSATTGKPSAPEATAGGDKTPPTAPTGTTGSTGTTAAGAKPAPASVPGAAPSPAAPTTPPAAAPGESGSAVAGKAPAPAPAPAAKAPKEPKETKETKEPKEPPLAAAPAAKAPKEPKETKETTEPAAATTPKTATPTGKRATQSKRKLARATPEGSAAGAAAASPPATSPESTPPPVTPPPTYPDKPEKTPEEAAAGGAAPATKPPTESGGAGEAPADPGAGAPAPHQLRITSTPAGADVMLDGEVVGKTPYSGADLDVGAPHSLTVRKDGYEPFEQMISASSGWKKAKPAKGSKGGAQVLKINTKLKKLAGAEAPASSAEPGGRGEDPRPELLAPPPVAPPAPEGKPAEGTP